MGALKQTKQKQKLGFGEEIPNNVVIFLLVFPLGRGWWNRRLENLGIAKIGLTPPPLPQSWHSGGFDDKSA